jgi:uncharacterized membrane protein YeaQ/YmgE (transglycosylase-associated protein family)
MINQHSLFKEPLMQGEGIIMTIIIGLIVGAIARFIMPGKQSMGWILTAVLGVAGSVLAGFVGQAMGWGTGAAGWIASVVGALVLLFVVGKVKGGSSN